MSAKYSKLPTEEPTDSTIIDFGSSFNYKSKNSPKYFSYSNNEKMYNSIFTYSGYKPDAAEIDVPPLTWFQKFCAGLTTVICYTLVFLGFPVTWWYCLKNVKENEILVVYRLGRLLAVKEPGRTIILPCLDVVTKINMKTRAFSVPPQKIITSDGAVVEVGADIFFRVKDPVLSVSSIQDLNHSLRIIAVASLQKHLSKLRLNHIESDKAVTTSLLHTEINQMALTWGVEIGKIELSQIKVLEEANPIVAAASGGSDNAMAFLGQLFGGSSVPLPMTGMPTMATVPATHTSAQQGQTEASGFTGRSQPMITPRYLVSVVKPFLNYELVRQHGVVVKFNIVGDGGGVFYLDLKNGEGSAGEGEPGDIPDVTLTMTLEDMNNLFTGEMSAFNAYMGGRLQVDGDLHGAMGLQDLVSRIQAQIGIHTV